MIEQANKRTYKQVLQLYNYRYYTFDNWSRPVTRISQGGAKIGVVVRAQDQGGGLQNFQNFCMKTSNFSLNFILFGNILTYQQH